MFLGVPFNLASYALLSHLIADQTGLDVRELIWVGGDTHIYDNHLDQVRQQLTRAPYPLPNLRLRRSAVTIDEYEWGDVELGGRLSC